MSRKKSDGIAQFFEGIKEIPLICSACGCTLSMGRIIKHRLYCLKCSDIKQGRRDKRGQLLKEETDVSNGVSH